LVQPNSVGYFTGLTTDLSQVESGKIEKMDRFHNIFAIQKARSNASPDDVSLWFRDDRVRIILSNPKSVVGSFSGATIPATILADLKLLSGVPVKIENPKSGKAPLEKMDLVVANASQVSSESTLQYLFELCHPHGFVVILADKPGAIRQNTKYRDLFVQIDHIEINVHFPDAPIAPYAAEIYAMSAYHDGIIAELGENTYPSNFAWRADHTRTDAVLAAMEEILQSDEATENGLLQYADILHRHRSPESAMVILRRLEKIDCRERRYFQMIGLNLQKSGDWENAAVIYGMALDKFAHDPQFTVNLAACYRRLSRQIEAEALLRQTLAENSRARPVVVMLSKILVHRGDLDEAVSLAEQSINLFPKVLRLPRLINLVQLALRADRPSVAEKALARAEELGPDDPDVHAARLAFNQHVSSS
jgi:tetratricopeptide (TPR) repeat protein